MSQAEGFGKARLFGILDGLEARTRGLMGEARSRLAREKGAAALEPHNTGHALAGRFCLGCGRFLFFEEVGVCTGGSCGGEGLEPQYTGPALAGVGEGLGSGLCWVRGPEPRSTVGALAGGWAFLGGAAGVLGSVPQPVLCWAGACRVGMGLRPPT